MKKTLKLFLLIAVAVAAMLLAVSCAGKAKGISVSKLYPYQTTYVLGQELDLSGGGLVITDDKGTYEMPLNYSEIKVSGYDKDKLGLQRITLEYMGAKTFISVTVVERMTINGFTADYLVGDSFDENKGKITVTKDDGSSEMLDFTSNKITVSGFDSSTQKIGSDIKVTYKDSTSKYESTFKVNIHPIDTIDFKSPDKKDYPSHYTVSTNVNGMLVSAVVPSVSGGKFTIYGNNGRIKREFPITADMIKGLDLSVVSEANPTATQDLTVTFLDKEYTYEITVTYSDVSRFRDKAAPFAEIDFTSGKPEISKELGELAITLTKILHSLSNSEKVVIGGGVSYPVARTAFIYAYDLWAEEMAKLDGAFYFTNVGSSIVCESYDVALAALEIFKDEDSPLYTFAPMLIQIIDDYTDDKTGMGMVVYGPNSQDNTNRYDKYFVPSAEEIKVTSAALTALIDVYEQLKSIPANWTVFDLTMNSAKLEAAYEKMVSEPAAAAFTGLYRTVSDWCGFDIFDALFTYLYGQEKLDEVQTLVALGTPSTFNKLYTYASEAAVAMNGIIAGIVDDASGFFLYYNLAKQVEAELVDGSVEKYLYENLALRNWGTSTTKEAVTIGVLLETLRATEKYGFDALFSTALADGELKAVIENYAALLEKMLDADYAESDGYKTDVMALFDAFAKLDLEGQYSFISTLYIPYSKDASIFKLNEGKTGFLFTTIVSNLVLEALPESCIDAYYCLTDAIETYVNKDQISQWNYEFTVKMAAIGEALDKLSEDDEKAFLDLLGDIYNLYVTYHGQISWS